MFWRKRKTETWVQWHYFDTWLQVWTHGWRRVR